MISGMLAKYFHARLDRVMFVHDALEMMRRCKYDLVLFNRLVFADGSEGIALLEAAKSDATLKATPVMMISNFPEAQAKAVAAGGEPGFGKAAVNHPATIELLARYLPSKPQG